MSSLYGYWCNFKENSLGFRIMKPLLYCWATSGMYIVLAGERAGYKAIGTSKAGGSLKSWGFDDGENMPFDTNAHVSKTRGRLLTHAQRRLSNI